MENGPFLDDFPIKTSIYKGFSMAMLNNQIWERACVDPNVARRCFTGTATAHGQARYRVPAGAASRLAGKPPTFGGAP